MNIKFQPWVVKLGKALIVILFTIAVVGGAYNFVESEWTQNERIGELEVSVSNLNAKEVVVTPEPTATPSAKPIKKLPIFTPTPSR